MRDVAVFLLLGGGLGLAQSGLPATPPTTTAQVASVSAAATPGRTESGPHRAEVVYSSKVLQVTADDSSLNQILREIARQTGMKITGGVADERVYGKYGPASPGKVLASLLEGTGSNMVLRETAMDAPTELILSTRNGGSTPPNPNAPGYDDDLRADESQGPRQAAPAGLPDVVSPVTLVPARPPATPGNNAGARGASASPNGPTDTSPNGVKTPQQIYQELQQLRQQQQVPH